jgi:predicted nucleic acid-binding protein
MIAGLIKKDLLALTSITVFELYAGVSGSKRRGQVYDLISLARIFPLGTEDALASVGIYNRLKKDGKFDWHPGS